MLGFGTLDLAVDALQCRQSWRPKDAVGVLPAQSCLLAGTRPSAFHPTSNSFLSCLFSFSVLMESTTPWPLPSSTHPRRASSTSSMTLQVSEPSSEALNVSREGPCKVANVLLDHAWDKAEDDQPMRASQNTVLQWWKEEGWMLCLVAPLSSAKGLWCQETVWPRTWFCSCTFACCVASELCETV